MNDLKERNSLRNQFRKISRHLLKEPLPQVLRYKPGAETNDFILDVYKLNLARAKQTGLIIDLSN